MSLRINSGIYCFTCTPTGKQYVGQSKKLTERLSQHKSDLRAGRNGNRYLQSSWSKYGEKQFKVEVLLYCAVNDLNDYEIRIISALKPVFNMSSGGEGVEFTPQVRAKLSKSISEKWKTEWGIAQKCKVGGKPGVRTGIRSEESKRKQSETRKSRTYPNPFYPDWVNEKIKADNESS
jgi:group I intron endonuclease